MNLAFAQVDRQSKAHMISKEDGFRFTFGYSNKGILSIKKYCGVSKNEEKPSHQVPKYLVEHGYNVIPVNPTVNEVLGRKCYPSIADIPKRIDIVDVFRKSEDIPTVIDDVLKKKNGIKVFWMQLGIYNEDAERKAKENGIDVVYNRCMMEEHKRLFGDRE